MLTLNVNGTDRSVEVEPDTPLLWVLRDELALTGTKFGCGLGLCGACTVLLNGRPIRSCVVPASAVDGQPILTIEGLSKDRSHPVQRAWIEASVPQCGYCQSGMILAAAALLQSKPKPTDQDIDMAMSNICRCGTYKRIREAIHRAAEIQSNGEPAPGKTPTSTTV
jgi:aerobic-type carbon monoxide dehydrogenase small subunit (CoxS/CutS family)